MLPNLAPPFWANQRLKKQDFQPAQDLQLHHHSKVEPASCLFTQAAKPRPHCRTSCPLSKASQTASTRKNKSCWICQNPLQIYDPINKNPVKITMETVCQGRELRPSQVHKVGHPHVEALLALAAAGIILAGAACPRDARRSTTLAAITTQYLTLLLNGCIILGLRCRNSLL